MAHPALRTATNTTRNSARLGNWTGTMSPGATPLESSQVARRDEAPSACSYVYERPERSTTATFAGEAATASSHASRTPRWLHHPRSVNERARAAGVSTAP